MHIAAVAVTSSDFEKTVAFYSLLGFQFPELKDDDQHVEAIVKEGNMRLMIDSKDLIKEIMGKEAIPASHSSFAIKCESPEEVNAVAEKVKDAGFTVIKEPWDAFWGQRYAIVADPNGYKVDLFAGL